MSASQIYGISAIVGDETTYGTLNATGDGVKVTIIGHSLSVSRNRTEVNEIDGTVTTARPTSGFRTVSGDITFRPRPKQLGHWLRYFINEPVTTGSGPYTHTFTPSTTDAKTFQMEIEHTQTTANEYEIYKGLTITGWSLDVGGDGQLEFTVSVTGQDKINAQASVFVGTVTDLTTETDVFEQFDSSLTSSDTFTAETSNLSISRPVEQFYAIGDGANASLLFKGKYGVTASLDILFEDDTIFDKARAETPTDIDFVFSDGTNSLTFTNDTMLWDESNMQIAAGTTKLVATMPVIGYNGFVVALVNGQASY